MAETTYWLDLFTWTTWQEFLRAGGTVSGFRESRWTTLQKVRVGDTFLCYLMGVSRFIGLLQVASKPFKDETRIWEQDVFPCRVGVKVVATLGPDTAIPIFELKDQLSIFGDDSSSAHWTGFVRSSPSKWSKKDGELVAKAILEACEHPVTRPFDQKKLARLPRRRRQNRVP